MAVLARAGPASSSFPGANGNLAYTSLDGGIYVVRAAGGQPREVSNNAVFDTNPAWSPDGTKIAFSSNRDGNLEIYAMDASGGRQVRLTNHAGVDFEPAWSPDGTRIAFTRESGGTARVHVMGADGSNAQAIGPPSSAQPDWSPDGTTLGFAGFGSTGTRIGLMRPDGSEVRYLTDGAAVDIYPSWAPDGRRLAFESDRDGTFEIWTINADGTGRTRLTSGSRFRCGSGCSLPRFGPAWSPDGLRIAFAHDRDGTAQAFVMSADGSGQTRVTSHHMDVQDVTWQPAVDLSAHVSALSTRAFAGRRLKVRVTTRNSSALRATALSVRVAVSGPASIVSARGGASCTAGRVWSCRRAELQAGSAASIDVMLLVRRAGRIAVTATVAPTEADADLTNNRGRATILVKRKLSRS